VEDYSDNEIAKIKELFAQLDVKGKGKVEANDLRGKYLTSYTIIEKVGRYYERSRSSSN
jgi:uncharacterized protein YktA (UPF0223 family)